MTQRFDYRQSTSEGNNQSEGSSVTMISRWLWSGNRAFLEVASMVASLGIVAFWPSETGCSLNPSLQLDTHRGLILCTVKEPISFGHPIHNIVCSFSACMPTSRSSCLANWLCVYHKGYTWSLCIEIKLSKKHYPPAQVTTMVHETTSKNVLFPGHNHLLTTGTDNHSLITRVIKVLLMTIDALGHS